MWRTKYRHRRSNPMEDGLLQGDTVIYMIGDGAISVQKVGRLSWSKQYNSDTDIIRYKKIA